MGRSSHRPVTRRQRRRLARRRGYAALGTGVAAIAAAGGVMAVLPHHTSTAQPVASACGAVACAAAAPSPAIASITANPGPTPRRSRKPHPRRHTPKPHPHRTSTLKPVVASPAAPATQPAGPPPTVTVTYTLVQKRSSSFQGAFTITNHGSSWLDGWRLVATLPGDQVTSASGSAYQVDGDTITFDQALLQAGIAPGASLTLNFDANGSTTRPGGCTLNGSACAA